MKILVVEDSMLYQKAIVKYLSSQLPEAEFVVAGDGKQGLELYQSTQPDVVLLDLLLPEMNGQEVLRRIKAIDPQAKAAVISADVQKIIQDEVRSLGIITFVNKPFTPEKAAELAALIKEG